MKFLILLTFLLLAPAYQLLSAQVVKSVLEALSLASGGQ